MVHSSPTRLSPISYIGSIILLRFILLLRLSSVLPNFLPRPPSPGSCPLRSMTVFPRHRVLWLWALVTRWRRSLSNAAKSIATIPGLSLSFILLSILVPVRTPISGLGPRPRPRPCFRPRFLPHVPGAWFVPRYYIVGQVTVFAPEAAGYLQTKRFVYRDDAAFRNAVYVLLCFFPDVTDIRALTPPPLPPRSRSRSRPRPHHVSAVFPTPPFPPPPPSQPLSPFPSSFPPPNLFPSAVTPSRP